MNTLKFPAIETIRQNKCKWKYQQTICVFNVKKLILLGQSCNKCLTAEINFREMLGFQYMDDIYSILSLNASHTDLFPSGINNKSIITFIINITNTKATYFRLYKNKTVESCRKPNCHTCNSEKGKTSSRSRRLPPLVSSHQRICALIVGMKTQVLYYAYIISQTC